MEDLPYEEVVIYSPSIGRKGNYVFEVKNEYYKTNPLIPLIYFILKKNRKKIPFIYSLLQKGVPFRLGISKSNDAVLCPLHIVITKTIEDQINKENKKIRKDLNELWEYYEKWELEEYVKKYEKEIKKSILDSLSEPYIIHLNKNGPDKIRTCYAFLPAEFLLLPKKIQKQILQKKLNSNFKFFLSILGLSLPPLFKEQELYEYLKTYGINPIFENSSYKFFSIRITKLIDLYLQKKEGSFVPSFLKKGLISLSKIKFSDLQEIIEKEKEYNQVSDIMLEIASYMYDQPSALSFFIIFFLYYNIIFPDEYFNKFYNLLYKTMGNHSNEQKKDLILYFLYYVHETEDINEEIIHNKQLLKKLENLIELFMAFMNPDDMLFAIIDAISDPKINFVENVSFYIFLYLLPYVTNKGLSYIVEKKEEISEIFQLYITKHPKDFRTISAIFDFTYSEENNIVDEFMHYHRISTNDHQFEIEL